MKQGAKGETAISPIATNHRPLEGQRNATKY